MSTITVADCPFCGYDDPEIGEIEPGRFAVDCPNCQCIGPFGDSAEEAIVMWNRAHRQCERGVRDADT